MKGTERCAELTSPEKAWFCSGSRLPNLKGAIRLSSNHLIWTSELNHLDNFTLIKFIIRLFHGLYFTGKLIPRHQSIFKSNQFFHGISIPEPEDMVNLLSFGCLVICVATFFKGIYIFFNIYTFGSCFLSQTHTYQRSSIKLRKLTKRML